MKLNASPNNEKVAPGRRGETTGTKEAFSLNSTMCRIGLELVRQLVADPQNIVVATCREPAHASKLTALKDGAARGRLHVIALDVGTTFSGVRTMDPDRVRRLIVRPAGVLRHPRAGAHPQNTRRHQVRA